MKLALEAPTKLIGIAQALSDFDYISLRRYVDDQHYAKACLESENKERFAVLDDKIADLKKVAAGLKLHAILTPASNYNQVIELFGREHTMPILEASGPTGLLSQLAMYQPGPISLPCNIFAAAGDSLFTMAIKRVVLAQLIPNTFYIHLQGMTDISEFEWYKDVPHIASVNTGLPVLLGLECKDFSDTVALFSDPASKEFSSMLDRMENLVAEGNLTNDALATVYSNVALIRKYLS